MLVGRSSHLLETYQGISDRICRGIGEREKSRVTLRFLAFTTHGRKAVGWGGVGGKMGILFAAPMMCLNADVDHDVGCGSLEFVKSSNRKNLTEVDLWD